MYNVNVDVNVINMHHTNPMNTNLLWKESYGIYSATVYTTVFDDEFYKIYKIQVYRLHEQKEISFYSQKEILVYSQFFTTNQTVEKILEGEKPIIKKFFNKAMEHLSLVEVIEG